LIFKGIVLALVPIVSAVTLMGSINLSGSLTCKSTRIKSARKSRTAMLSYWICKYLTVLVVIKSH